VSLDENKNIKKISIRGISTIFFIRFMRFNCVLNGLQSKIKINS